MKAVYFHLKSLKARWRGITHLTRHNSGRTGRQNDNRAARRAARRSGKR